jgi:dihydrofolate synthase / folylpolyglutamate synthase
VQVLTNVGLEHTRWLGPTERHIAEEKLAVVKPGATLVTGPLGGDSLAVAERVTRENDATLLRLGVDFTADAGLELRPLGGFQRDNFAVAVAAAEAFRGEPLDPDAVRAAARELHLPGRLEITEHEPLVVLDGAHNPAGARALAESLPAVIGGRELVVVLSILDDKDAAGILGALVPHAAGAVFTSSPLTATERHGLPPAVLESLWRQLGGPAGEVVPDPAAALARARERATPAGAVLVTGSIYLLAGLVTAGAARSAAVNR